MKVLIATQLLDGLLGVLSFIRVFRTIHLKVDSLNLYRRPSCSIQEEKSTVYTPIEFVDLYTQTNLGIA